MSNTTMVEIAHDNWDWYQSQPDRAKAINDAIALYRQATELQQQMQSLPKSRTNHAKQAKEAIAQVRAENVNQVKAISRILGASAQIANNHDRLIDEVTAMVESDLQEEDE